MVSFPTLFTPFLSRSHNQAVSTIVAQHAAAEVTSPEDAGKAIARHLLACMTQECPGGARLRVSDLARVRVDGRIAARVINAGLAERGIRQQVSGGAAKKYVYSCVWSALRFLQSATNQAAGYRREPLPELNGEVHLFNHETEFHRSRAHAFSKVLDATLTRLPVLRAHVVLEASKGRTSTGIARRWQASTTEQTMRLETIHLGRQQVRR